MSGPPSPAMVAVARPADQLEGGLSSPRSSPDVSCEGYVGQGAAPAGEYHDCDFDWEEHARAVRHLVDDQEARGRELQRLRALHDASPANMQGQAAVASQAPTESSIEADPGHGGHEKLAQQQAQHQRSTPEVLGEQPPAAASTGSQSTATDTAATTSATLPATTKSTHPAAPSTSQAVAAYDHASWEEFYRAHPSAKFFKERRYLLLEFPQLLRSDVPLHVAEIGCGCGSSLLPVLKANPSSRATGTDISSTCLEQLQAAARLEGIAPERLHLFPADATDPSLAPAFAPIAADALLIMFTLSAVVPEQQLVMLAHAYGSLRPGGQLLIRDHGLYDMVQLRIPAEQWVEPNTYKRGDKTIAHFFSTEALAERARAVGFEVQECKYVTVVNRNRKKGQELRRVFVHGVFVRPE